MLDTNTKRRIDSARDILVGRVPDPKSQVEQITIALIYKFMDDMDADSEMMGGQRKFFAGEFAKYGWAKVMQVGFGGHEMVNLYAEGIDKIRENPGVPLLFRNIFKNYYLPFREPDTLRMFLKVIGEFEYDHSERLGDAFEYLLSVLGSQGDAGQFRTPRHIIDFMVRILDPKKNETILDPACGTAGFLISAYKHILAANTDAKGHSKLTPEELGKLAKNIKGYDISPDMVRLSLVNLYLHGFADPHVYEYDTLTSEDRWNEYADVILANPPFMSPKGGIKPHKRFTIDAKRSEVLFVDYMAEHLTPNGRAAIIVPEGIIFQSQTAYKELRKMLVENSLVAVISLPAGCFNPYSGVKTSILILDRSLAKQSNTVGFFKVENDGFGLGAQRREITKNDLPAVQGELTAYLDSVRSGQPFNAILATGQIVTKERIATNGDYNFSGERYREVAASASSFPTVPLGDVCNLIGGATPSKQNESFWTNGSVKWISSKHIDDQGSINEYELITKKALEETSTRVVPKGSTIIITRVSVGKFAFADDDFAINQDLTALVSKDADRLAPEFIRIAAHHIAKVVERNAEGIGVRGVTRSFLSDLKIPLPPLEVQREIVAEIEGYQRIINGARAVVENYRPQIPIHADWQIVEIGAISTIVRGSSPRPQGDPNFFGGPVPRLMVADITRDGMYTTPKIDSLTELGASKSRPMKQGDVIITVSGNPGLPTILAIDACIHDGFVGLRNLSKDVLAEYLYFALLAQHAGHGSQSVGAVFKNLTTDQIREFTVALPPLETQRFIVSEIEAEQALVAANRELIARFERKIQTTLARIWGDENNRK